MRIWVIDPVWNWLRRPRNRHLEFQPKALIDFMSRGSRHWEVATFCMARYTISEAISLQVKKSLYAGLKGRTTLSQSWNVRVVSGASQLS
jgi:hypothetical protein